MYDMALKKDTSTSGQTAAGEGQGSAKLKETDKKGDKIDRFSLLPNELLDHIFNLAYSIDTPSTGALSKHLLPFHITGIYRRISLTKADNIVKLFEKIRRSPKLAKIVKMIHLDCEEDPFGGDDHLATTEIEQFFRQLIHSEWLDLGKDRYEWLDRLTSPHNVPLSIPIRHITSGASSHPQPLLDFTSLPTLRSLHITTYEFDYEVFDPSGHSSLPLLTHLTVSGVYADDLSIGSFCTLCPSLTHLTLACPSPAYADLLKNLHTKLLRLDLQCLDEQPVDLCELFIGRFSHLRHLILGDGMFTSLLPLHLLSLRALEILELGQGRISTNRMQELFDKIPINRLKLDLTRGKIGYRLEVEENGSAGGRWVPGDGRLIAGDWVIPEFDISKDGDFTLEGAREMIRTAEEMGIEVEGSIIRAIEVMDAYYLEIANLAIYRCFRDKTLDYYLDVEVQLRDIRLPPLDLGTLDPKHLKLVKSELEEEGWFALTLAN